MDPQNNENNYEISNSSSLHQGMNEEAFRIPRNITVEFPQYVAAFPVSPAIGNPQTPQAPLQFVQEEHNAKIKNIFILSIGLTLLYTGYGGMECNYYYFQHEDTEGAGITWFSEARHYYWVSIIVGSLFLPTYVIRKFMAKRIILVSMLIYVLYIALLSYPKNYTIIPCNILLGLSTTTLWTATYFYIASVGNCYASARNDNAQAVTVSFLGIFFLFYQTKNMWIYPLVLESVLEKANFSYNFAAIFVAFAVAGVLIIVLFMDPLTTRYVEDQREGGSITVIDLAFANLLQLVNNPYQLLIIPLTIWAGVDQAIHFRRIEPYFVIDGRNYNGHYYVLIFFLFFNGLASITFGPLIRIIGRIPIFTFGSLLNLGTFIYVHYSDITPQFYNYDDYKYTVKQNIYSVYVYEGIWGVSTALWTTQLIGFYGDLFSNNLEPAFSNYTLWTTVGHIFYYLVQEGSNSWKSRETFFWIHKVVLLAGMIGYYVIEVKERRKSRSFP